jgi:xylulokinase
MADLFLAIDVGSTSVKAAVFDGSGQCRSRFAQSYPTARPRSTEATQNPDDWMGLIRAALAQFASEGLGGAVGFGSMCSHVNTHVFVDKNGAALAPAILWQDIRAAREAAELDAMITQADKIKYLGAPIAIDASHPLARMAWMARNHPEIWQQTAYVLLPKDYCLWHLTGVLATDPLSNVGLVGPDLRYVGPILDLLDGAAQRMAPLRGITDSIGQIAPAFELRGVQMVNGTMDGWMGLYGAGAGQAGDMVYLSGTSEILGTSSPHAAGTAGIIVFPDIGGMRLHAGPTQSGGASQMWFCAAAGVDISTLSQRLLDTPRRRPTPLFLPQLAGERAPLWNPNLRGAFLGLDGGMGATDLARAVLEGVAMSARHVLGAISASSGVDAAMLKCGGGGFASNAWGQIRADVLNKSLTRLAVGEPGLVGAAALAAYGAGGHNTLAGAQAQFAQFDKTWHPNPDNRALYDDLFGIYTDAIAANDTIGQRIAQL